VTFIDNHDTGSTQRHWPFPRLKKIEGYAYIMTHPGTPTVFWEHMFEDSTELAKGIKALIAMRKELGITAVSEVEVLNAEQNQYLAETTGESGVARIRMGRKKELGKYEMSEGDGWELVLEGLTVRVWKKASA
jgi:alpha-amylase